MEYFDVEKNLSLIYLEDSYVLAIDELPNKIVFDMEFALLKGHPQYTLPLIGEQHCYKKGQIIFEDCGRIIWIGRSSDSFPLQSDDELDYGNIDALEIHEKRFELEGDWGSVEIEATSINVILL